MHLEFLWRPLWLPKVRQSGHRPGAALQDGVAFLLALRTTQSQLKKTSPLGSAGCKFFFFFFPIPERQ